MQINYNEEESLEAELHNSVVYQCVESDCTARVEMARSGSDKKKKFCQLFKVEKAPWKGQWRVAFEEIRQDTREAFHIWAYPSRHCQTMLSTVAL